MPKPELLLPAGNIENLHAALEGGADAVYLGLKQFNARGRASNFTFANLKNAIDLFHQNGKKVYVTLNTVIKNSELNDLIDYLYTLEKLGPDAVIIQDWGVLQLVRYFFKEIELHSSTQMGVHNSIGANYAGKLGFERVILARELTMKELETISENTNTEMEVFVHGALCYSLSGMCLFSSYLGGSGANRGLCTQPCRRKYDTGPYSEYYFNLKDNQLITHVHELADIRIRSLKVEGRMRSAEYVYNVAKAYRMVIDNPEKIAEAEDLLKLDLGREKTQYFVGGNISQSLAEIPATGKLAGKVLSKSDTTFIIESNIKLQSGNRIWISSSDGSRREALKIKELTENEGRYEINHSNNIEIQKGDTIYLANLREKSFKSKFDNDLPFNDTKPPKELIREIHKSLRAPENESKKETLFFRIPSLQWLKKIRINDPDYIIFNFTHREWRNFDTRNPFFKKNSNKFIVQLPPFIPEATLPDLKKLIGQLKRSGISNFMINHLSQIWLVPKVCEIFTSENVLVFNDATISFLRDEEINQWIYPLENDMENLLAGRDRKGIVPLHFHPSLFISRMPVKLSSKWNFKERGDQEFRKVMLDNLVNVVPVVPVNLFSYRKKLIKEGFTSFLIDFSHEPPSQNVYKRLLNKYEYAEQVQPSTGFNFKKGLK